MLNPRPCGEENETTAAVYLIYIPPDNAEHAVHSINCIILKNFNAEILNLITINERTVEMSILNKNTIKIFMSCC